MQEKNGMIREMQPDTSGVGTRQPDVSGVGTNQQDAEAKGKVWLVGAGPSDPGLFTLKGRQVLADAEVVVYDALVGASILSMIPDTAEAINVGKRSSRHTMRQEQISELLAEKAKEGKRVVRLKGGDPFLFGRGGEELEVLVREQIPYEVVPGVTSAIAVPAYQGIPVTHRDYCSSVHIITGHRREGEESRIDFEALVRTGGTLIFLMGVSSLRMICEGLLAAGMRRDMPAALLARGTTAAQERIVATVATLPQAVEAHGAITPAIIVVGEVCGLAEQFSWVEKLPLGGIRVAVTRPRELAGTTAGRLRELGAEVLELPAIRTVARRDSRELLEALDGIERYQWIVFTSPTGVRVFFEVLADRGIDLRRLGGAKFAVIGAGSAKELGKHGLYADLMPEVYDGAHLGAALAAECRLELAAGCCQGLVAECRRELTTECRWELAAECRQEAAAECLQALPTGCETASGKQGRQAAGAESEKAAEKVCGLRILIPRASAGNRELTDALRAVEGLAVDDIPSYDTEYGLGVSAEEVLTAREDLLDGLDYVLFTSASTVRGFAAAAGAVDFSKVRAVCIGRQTRSAADALGMRTWMAEQATIDSLIERLVEVVCEQREQGN